MQEGEREKERGERERENENELGAFPALFLGIISKQTFVYSPLYLKVILLMN